MRSPVAAVRERDRSSKRQASATLARAAADPVNTNSVVGNLLTLLIIPNRPRK